jgi:hypothetical protein
VAWPDEDRKTEAMMNQQSTGKERQCSEKCESSLRDCLNAGENDTYCRIQNTQCQISCTSD